MAKKEKRTYQDALQEYYGGIMQLNAQPFPWKCKCRHESMHLAEIWAHIRKDHNTTLKR